MLLLKFTSEEALDWVYLRPETKLEPLACRFYAWPHPIAPAQPSLHLYTPERLYVSKELIL